LLEQIKVLQDLVDGVEACRSISDAVRHVIAAYEDFRSSTQDS